MGPSTAVRAEWPAARARRAMPPPAIAPRRVAANFAALSCAEFLARATSMIVTLVLARRLGTVAYGRIEFSFQVVIWLVLLVREGFDLIGTREIARRPRLVRPIVNQFLALRAVIAGGLLALLATIGGLTLSQPEDRALLCLYGLLLATTALGLEYAFRGLERMGLVAASLTLRTTCYALAVVGLVHYPDQIALVPLCLIAAEGIGTLFIWTCYVRRFGLPRPTLHGDRFIRVVVQRGRSVYVMQVGQAVLGSIDVVVVGLASNWAEIGLYSASHRTIMAALTVGLIFQQAVVPGLARTWRAGTAPGRVALDGAVRVLALGFVPLAAGVSALAGPIVAVLFQPEFADAAPLLAIGIWRAPLMVLAFLYQTSHIALNRAPSGLAWPVLGVIVAGPLVGLFYVAFGLLGASGAMVLVAAGLAVAGYVRLAREGRQPSWHHHALRPFLAAAVMVLVCRGLRTAPLGMAIGAGAVSYGLALALLGGLEGQDFQALRPGPDRTRTLDVRLP